MLGEGSAKERKRGDGWLEDEEPVEDWCAWEGKGLEGWGGGLISDIFS